MRVMVINKSILKIEKRKFNRRLLILNRGLIRRGLSFFVMTSEHNIERILERELDIGNILKAVDYAVANYGQSKMMKQGDEVEIRLKDLGIILKVMTQNRQGNIAVKIATAFVVTGNRSKCDININPIDLMDFKQSHTFPNPYINLFCFDKKVVGGIYGIGKNNGIHGIVLARAIYY